ncbi:homeobox protein vex1-like [Gigantopelta aegis]|uniref:homeobox protein vex1-like n=1 Tax=Gigantopelta aegis TaxID=1735272 RepID=UPI001B8897A3|nr:homeobox protein vex1-like [Gigantopelta aegis]
MAVLPPDLTPASSPRGVQFTPPTTPDTCDAEISPGVKTSPGTFPGQEAARAHVHIPEHAPAPYYPIMHPYAYPHQPFGGFPYGYGAALPFPGFGYPPSFGFPSPMTNLPFPAASYSGNSDQKENIFCPAQELPRPKQHDVIRKKIDSLTRDRPDDCTEVTSRSSDGDSPSPVLGRTRTTSFSSSDDTTRVSNTSLESIKNDPCTPSPDKQTTAAVKKRRTNYTARQVQALEKVFQENPYPDSEVMEALSHDINIPEKKLKNWFQNKRTRNKKKIQENHQQMIYPSAHPYYMPSLPPQLMPPFSPYFPLTSPNPMIPSTVSPSSLTPRSTYSFPGSSPLGPVPGMLLPTRQYNPMSQQC